MKKTKTFTPTLIAAAALAIPAFATDLVDDQTAIATIAIDNPVVPYTVADISDYDPGIQLYSAMSIGGTLEFVLHNDDDGAVTWNPVSSIFDAFKFSDGASLVINTEDLTMSEGESVSVSILRGTITFGGDGTENTLTSDNLDEFLGGYLTTVGDCAVSDWKFEDGVLSFTVSAGIMPEPELFSMFFGLGALAVISTRRRRRRAV